MLKETVGARVVDAASLPDISLAEVDFRDTSYFQSTKATSLSPTPREIIKKNPRMGNDMLVFKDRNLVVKIGQPAMVKFEEAAAMIARKKAFPNNEVPVPEVFGWRSYLEWNFIYMSYVPGITLREAWPQFLEKDKELICSQLRQIVCHLRSLTQGTEPRFIGSVIKGSLTDRHFRWGYEEGPLDSVEAFNELFLAAATRQKFGSGDLMKPPQHEYFPTDSNIYFTHGDLTLSNIMITGSPGSFKVEAVIDWEQAGWYPEWLEYCKMLYAIEEEHEFRDLGWAEKVMDPWEDIFDLWAEYTQWRMP